jgi:hypothetical protein
MADHTVELSITIPENQLDRVISAMRIHYGPIEDVVDENGAPIFRDMTAGEVGNKIKEETRQRVIDIVRSVENQAAARAAVSAVSDVNVT